MDKDAVGEHQPSEEPPENHQPNTDWLGLALESTAHTLLVRRPGDPDAGFHAAIDSFASTLDVESVVLYGVSDDQDLRCLAAWSPGNHVLTGDRRSAIVDPILESLRTILLTDSATATGFGDLSEAALSSLGQWGHVIGSMAVVPTIAEGPNIVPNVIR